MTTKEKILLEALKLFSQKGYDAVGVEQIAKAVGIKAPSLYKHYKGKKDIFEAIFEETSKRYDSFADSIAVNVTYSESDTETLKKISPSILVDKAKAFVQYSLHDEFVSQFRRMLTIEQFRSPELSALYSQRFVEMLFSYHKRVFQRLIDTGIITGEDPSTLAIMYGSPILVFIGECDRHPEKEEECIKAIEAHVKLFYKLFKKEVNN